MAVDDNGNDISQVGVALTGFAAIALNGAEPLEREAGAVVPLTLAPDYRKVGLRTEDGAPEWSEEPDGDPIEFFEDGYSIHTGKGVVTVVMTLAQTSGLVALLRSGEEYDEHGAVDVSVGSNTATYSLFTEQVYANSMIRRREAERATVATVVTQKDTRGEVTGHTVTFNVHRWNGRHYREWLITPEGGEQGGMQAQGMSTQSAAAVPDETWTVADLRVHAEQTGVDLAGASTKADILTALST